MEKFKSFLTEQKGEKYKILVISSKPKESEMFHTAERFAEEGKAAGHKVYIVQVESAYIRYEDDAYYVHNSDDKKKCSKRTIVNYILGSVVIGILFLVNDYILISYF